MGGLLRLLPGLEFVTEQVVPSVTEPAAARPSRFPLAGATGGSRRAAAEGDVLCTSAHVGMPQVASSGSSTRTACRGWFSSRRAG